MTAFFTDVFDGPAGSAEGRVGVGVVWNGNGDAPVPQLDGAGRLVAGTDGDGSPEAQYPFLVGTVTGEFEGFVAGGLSVEVYLPPAWHGGLQLTPDLGPGTGAYGSIAMSEFEGAYYLQYTETGLLVPGTTVNLRYEAVQLPGGEYAQRTFVAGVLFREDVYPDFYGTPWGPATAVAINFYTGGDHSRAPQIASISFDDEITPITPSGRPPAFWTNFRRTYEIR